MFHDEFWKPVYFGSEGQWSRSQVTKHCQCESLHSYECWFVLVVSALTLLAEAKSKNK